MPLGQKGFQKGNKLGVKFQKGLIPPQWQGGKNSYWRDKARKIMGNLDGVVHHIDGNVRNNDLSNLQVLPNQGVHVAIHNRQRKGIKRLSALRHRIKDIVLNMAGSSREIGRKLGIGKTTVLRIRKEYGYEPIR